MFLQPQTTICFIHLHDTERRLVLFGSNSESIPLYLKAKSGGTWKGLKLSNCEDAYLRNTVIENVSPYPVDSTYSVELTDCNNVQVTNCTFESSSTGKTGSLLLNYTSQAILKTSFSTTPSTEFAQCLQFVISRVVEIPDLEWNDFDQLRDNTLHSLSNAVGGALKENNFIGYDNSVMMLGSSLTFTHSFSATKLKG